MEPTVSIRFEQVVPSTERQYRVTVEPGRERMLLERPMRWGRLWTAILLGGGTATGGAILAVSIFDGNGYWQNSALMVIFLLALLGGALLASLLFPRFEMVLYADPEGREPVLWVRAVRSFNGMSQGGFEIVSPKGARLGILTRGMSELNLLDSRWKICMKAVRRAPIPMESQVIIVLQILVIFLTFTIWRLGWPFYVATTLFVLRPLLSGMFQMDLIRHWSCSNPRITHMIHRSDGSSFGVFEESYNRGERAEIRLSSEGGTVQELNLLVVLGGMLLLVSTVRPAVSEGSSVPSPSSSSQRALGRTPGPSSPA